MKKKLINPNWFKQRKVTAKTFKNEAYLKHLETEHSMPMDELIEHCKFNAFWVPSRGDFDNRKS